MIEFESLTGWQQIAQLPRKQTKVAVLNSFFLRCVFPNKILQRKLFIEMHIDLTGKKIKKEKVEGRVFLILMK